jgi:hypothetical protein
MTQIRFAQFFSVDSPKAIKASKYGYLNGINYMSPARSGGVGNLCSHASPGCIALCLGLESGQAGIVTRDAQGNATGTNATRESRRRKAEYFMRERLAYMSEMLIHVARLARRTRAIARARHKRLALAVRPNGSTDIAYEGIRVFVSPEFAARLSAIAGLPVTPGLHTVFSAFPSIQFLDYTKNPRRFERPLPANYHLTFSLSETNESDARALLARGVNVAVCFAGSHPATYLGARVIDGDTHDLRHLDPRDGVIVGLTPKGTKARRDTSGFVVRDAAERNARETCRAATPQCHSADLA